jgi:hypothetical protein
VGSFLTIGYNSLFSHGLWSGMRTNSIVKGESLFLSLAHMACRAHPDHLLYPMDKKLLKGQIGYTNIKAQQLFALKLV